MGDRITYLFYLAVPFILLLAIIGVTGYYMIKDREPIVNEVSQMFEKVWKESSPAGKDEEETFEQVFLRLFTHAYKYEGYMVSQNKNKFFLYKTLTLLVIASVPFLMLLLFTKKTEIMGDNEWNEMYLYIIIVVPVMLAYLLNKYINVKQYHDLWVQHAKIKYHLEYRMMVLVKDYELKIHGLNPEEAQKEVASMKKGFIDEMTEYWNTSVVTLSDDIMSKEDNLFQEIGKLLHGVEK